MEIELIPEDLIATLEGSVERLKVIYSENQKGPLSDDVTEVMQLCVTVEAVLRHQQKEKVSFWGERRDYWHYLSESVGHLKDMANIVKMVQAQTQYTTGLGRGRALIRECLCEGLLADCIQAAVSNVKRTREWYHPTAILLLPAFSERVLTALYDVSQVTFDLQSEGINLDETWPSFVLKSFDHSPSHRSPAPDPSPQQKSLFNVLGSGTQEAAVAGKNRGRAQRSVLERAVEEHPTEIFVKHDVPFNLPLVGSLLTEIRGNLIGQCDDHMIPYKNALPDLKVEKMDDITSCLTVLSEYMGSWSQGMAEYNTNMVAELKLLKSKLADLELQLQETLIESETSESNLLSQIQRSRNDLKSREGEAQHLSTEVESLSKDNMELRRKVSELETLNFDLEEQLMRSNDEHGQKRQRAYTILEASLTEKDQDLTQAMQTLENRQQEVDHLQRQLEEAELRLKNNTVSTETLRLTQATVDDLNSDLEKRRAREKELESSKSRLEEDLQKLKSDCETQICEMEQKFRAELNETKERLEAKSNRCKNMIFERDQARTELGSMHGLVESETSSLRFQLSTQAIDLQKATELNTEHEQVISEYQSRVAGLESQLREVTERCESAEGQIEELKTELQDMESILSSNKEELTSITEQLAEESLSRDLERSQSLRLHTEVESLSNMLVMKGELGKQVEKLTQENEDLRKAFKKLLQQKVTLWQHADKLEQEQVAKGTWINEKTVTECMGCGAPFTVFNRKHHCRSCGKVFCTSCCDKKAQLPFSKVPVRVCEMCHDKIQDVRTPMSSKMVNTLDMESLIFAQALGTSPDSEGDDDGGGSLTPNRRSSNSLNISRNVEVNGNSLQARLHHQNVAGSLPSIEDTESTVSGDNGFHDRTLEMASQYLDPGSTGPMFETGSVHSVNSSDYMVDPELKQREAAKLQLNGTEEIDTAHGCVRISTVEGDSVDDSYYVIESDPQNSAFPVGIDSPGAPRLDVDALASKLASLEVTNIIEKSHARRVSDGSTTGTAKSSEYREEVMEGGAVHIVPMTIQKIGTAIVWEFSTEPKGIAFGISYKEKKDSKREDEVLPLKRCSSHKTTLTGEYVSQKTGVYLLKFDNCHSKYTGRKLLYKIWTRSPL